MGRPGRSGPGGVARSGLGAASRRVSAPVHHTLTLTVAPAATDELLDTLERLDGVLDLAVHRGHAIKPAGDVVTVSALNREVDAVLAAAGRARRFGPTAVSTAGLESLIVSGAQGKIDDDADESSWEEFDRSLRHHGRISINYVALMAVGAVIAVAGLLSPPVPQALALAAAAIVAPAFEPVAKLALVLVRPSGYGVRRALVAIAVGYATLAAAGAVTFLVLRGLGLAGPKALAVSEGIHMIVDPTAADWLVAACGAAAGVLIITSFREAVLAGALIALALVPAAALTGAALVNGDLVLAVEALQRTAVDMALIVGLGALITGAKQRFLHRGRAPLA